MTQKRHGEYKTSGGKLVGVDFSVTGGMVRDVVVHGDFFLYPDDALAAITSSVEQAPITLTTNELEHRIAEAIPAGTEWLGSSPGALAIAIRRGIDINETGSA